MIRIIARVKNYEKVAKAMPDLILVDYEASIDTANPPTVLHVVESIECDSEEEAVTIVKYYNKMRTKCKKGISLKEAQARVRNEDN